MRMRYTGTQLAGTQLAVVLVLAGCGGDAPDPPGGDVAVRDSAGIRVVEFDPGALPVRRLAADPTWSFETISTPEGEHVLSGVIPLPLGDGRLAIAESSTMRVWVGTPGADDWIWGGGRGGGPSELERITDFELGPDGSLWVQDGARLRVVRFDDGGGFVEAMPFADVGMRGPNWSIRSGTHYFLGSGDGVGPDPEMGVFRRTAPLIRWSPDDATDTLTVMPTVEWFVSDFGVGGTLLAPYAHAAGAPGGHWIGDSARPEIEFWTEGPGPEVVVRWPFVDVDMQRLGDSILDATWDALPEPQKLPQAREMLDAVPVSESVPQFTDLVARFDGGVAIGPWWPRAPAPAPRPSGEWMIVDADGRPVGRVRLPRGLRPTWFGAGHVIGVRTDDLGRERVERWEVEE